MKKLLFLTAGLFVLVLGGYLSWRTALPVLALAAALKWLWGANHHGSHTQG